MFLIGFIGGVLLMLLLMLLCDDGEDRFDDESEEVSMLQEVQTELNRRQTRNFLYYDGTVMPTIKEEPNEQ